MASSLVSTALLLLIAVASIHCDEAVKFQYKSPTELKCTLSGPVEFYKVAPAETDGNSTKVSEPVKIEDSDGLKIESNTLTIVDPRRGDIESKYYCQQPEGKRIQKFENQVLPYVAKPEKASLTITEGGYAEMVCKVLYGNENNRAVTWKWIRNGTEVVPSERLQVSSMGAETKLNISSLEMGDKGEYECHLSNEFGEHSEKVVLRVKDALAVLWPFLAILAEVLILSTIILVYEKKCSKKPQREEETEQTQNLMGEASNGSDLKKRTAKA